MRCQKCGKKLKQNETFCTVCGFFNEPDTDLDDSSWETVSSKNEKDLKTIDDIKLDNEDEKEEDIYQDVADDEDEVIETDVDLDELIKTNDDIIDIVDEEEIAKKEKKEKKKEKPKEEKISSKEKEFYYEDEDILEAYIGEDYKIVKKTPFNIYAFIFSWIYLLYRKLYFTGAFGLFLTGLIIVCFKSLVITGIYAFISMLFWGIFFNKYYIFIARKIVKHIKNKADDTDRFKIINICAKKGGVNFVAALIIYLAFLIFLLIVLFNIRVSKSQHSKFWSENSENKATCIKLIKLANTDLKKNENFGSIADATCKVEIGENSVYNVYLKTNIDFYLHYQAKDGYLVYKNSTENINEYQEKEVQNTLTDEEKQILTEKQNIKYTYTNIYNDSIQEDRLIEMKKNKSPKKNFYFKKDEITR